MNIGKRAETATIRNPAGGTKLLPMISRRVTATLVTIVAVFAIVAATAARGALTYTGISPVDELVHFDYAYKAYEGDLIPSYPYNAGFTITQELCRGVLPVFPNAVTPSQSACARGVTDSQAEQEQSIDYVLMYPPLYYAVVALGMHVLHPFGVPLFTAARMVNVFLYALAAALLALALVRVGVSRRFAFGAVLAVATIPGVEFWGETVTPDSSALLYGAVGLLLLTADMSHRRRAILGTAVGIISGLVTDNLAPVGAVVAAACFLFPDGLKVSEAGALVRWPRGRWLIAALASVGAVLAIPLVWSEFRFLVIPVLRHFNEQALHGTATLTGSLASATVQFVQPLSYGYFVTADTGTMIFTLLNAVLFGGAAVFAFSPVARVGRTVQALAWGYLVALALDVLYVVLPFYVRGHSYVATVRYAVELIPLAVVAVAVALDHGRWMRWIVCVGGVATSCYFAVHMPTQFI